MISVHGTVAFCIIFVLYFVGFFLFRTPLSLAIFIYLQVEVRIANGSHLYQNHRLVYTAIVLVTD